MRITARPYEDADWEEMCDIHDRARPNELLCGSFDPAAFLPLVETAGPEGLFDGEVWVACEAGGGGSVVGFVAKADDEITWLYIDPDHHGRGIGRRLLRHAVERCGAVVRTEALAGKAPAIGLYEGEGFEVVETRSGKLAGNERFAATGVELRLRKR